MDKYTGRGRERGTKSGEVVPAVEPGGCGGLDILLRLEVRARRIQLTQTALGVDPCVGATRRCSIKYDTTLVAGSSARSRTNIRMQRGVRLLIPARSLDLLEDRGARRGRSGVEVAASLRGCNFGA
jgi:hypothetical protein